MVHAEEKAKGGPARRGTGGSLGRCHESTGGPVPVSGRKCPGILAALSVGAALFVATSVARAQAPHREQLAAKLQTALQRLATDGAGVVGIAVLDLATGQRFGVNDTLVFPQGSAIKIPILIELFRRADEGDLELTERLPLRAADRVGGSGLLQYFSDAGSELSLRDLAVAMIVLSDNTAANLLIDRLGMDRVNRTMAELGAPRTRLLRQMIRPAESVKGNENLSTPRDYIKRH